MAPVRYEVGQIFSPLCFSSFKNQNMHLKIISLLLKLLEVTTYIYVALKSPLKDSLPKMPLGKLNFLQIFFLESEAQVNKNNYRMVLFMSEQVSLPKNSLILQEMKVSPKCIIHPF